MRVTPQRDPTPSLLPQLHDANLTALSQAALGPANTSDFVSFRIFFASGSSSVPAMSHCAT
jgi:hypothetical protein